ncbi:hypothetical protein PVAND_015889 [Polypedilum vanderplanki]|uniref:ornithine decarboxylase n=1 Tax=Polypedilum vanderplanki TaxID=319348 RepID=A0A9J6BDJ1_POLVA|nr:hypothetical protein PVAND_015889 [Polypedilum vanderplanki]
MSSTTLPKETVQIIDKFDLFQLVHDRIKEIGIDESFFITDVGDVVKKFILWKELFPRIEPDFAIKSNNLPVIASTLAALGAGFDCASHGEITQVLEMGVEPEKIVFAQTVKPIYNIKLAKEKNVFKMTFDNENELYKVKEHFPEAHLLLRLGFSPKSSNKIAFGAKFGCSFETGKDLLKKAKELNLNVKGVAFHIGVGCEEYEIFRKAIEDSSKMFEYGKSLGFNMDVLDIGGGFPGHETKTIREVSKVINESIEQNFPDPSVKIISEPGQFFATHSMTLVVNVHSKAVKLNENGEKIFHYYITDGIYQSFAMKGSGGNNPNPLVVKTLRDTSGDNLKKSVIWGRCCDPNDQVESEILLPELKCGDWLVLEDFGAYRITTSSKFNGFPQHTVFNYIEKEMWDFFMKIKLSNIEVGYHIKK